MKDIFANGKYIKNAIKSHIIDLIKKFCLEIIFLKISEIFHM